MNSNYNWFGNLFLGQTGLKLTITLPSRYENAGLHLHVWLGNKYVVTRQKWEVAETFLLRSTVLTENPVFVNRRDYLHSFHKDSKKELCSILTICNKEELT